MALKFLNDAYFAAKVGIGTESPETALHVVSGGIGVQGTSGSAALTAPGIWMGGDGTSALIYGREGSTWKPAYLDSSALYINAQSGGNVGIGTDSPASNLDIFSTGTSTLTLSYDGGAGTGSTIDFSLINAGVSQPITTQIKAIDDGFYRQNLSFLTKTSATGASALSTRMIILANGNVGIGTTSPTAKLQVSGASFFTSDLFTLQNKGIFFNGISDFSSGIAGIDSGTSVRIFAGGSEKVRVKSTGNVGIGTTSPSGLLHLSSTSPSIYIEDTDATNTYNITRINGAGGNLSFDTRRSSDGGFVSTDYQIVKGATGADYQRWFTIGTERMRITAAGNVGIGTISPVSPLTVKSNSVSSGESGIVIQANGNTNSIIKLGERGTDGGRLEMLDANVTKIALYTDGTSNYINAGNVGIGTTSPDYKLQVSGTIAPEGNEVNNLGSSTNRFNQLWTKLIYDINDGRGLTNQILTSTGSGGIAWANASTVIGGPYLPLAGGTMTAGAVVTFLASSGSTDDRLKFGSSGQMQLFHDGSDGYIVNSLGDVRMDVNTFRVRSSSGAETMIKATQNDNVELYFNNVRKIRTTSGGVFVEGEIKIDSALLSNQENTDVDTGAEVVAQVSTSTYTAAFFDFVIKKVGNIRSGTVYACHDGTNVEFTETSTQDLGDTSDVTLSVDKSGTNLRLIATVTSDDWIIKSLIRAI